MTKQKLIFLFFVFMVLVFVIINKPTNTYNEPSVSENHDVVYFDEKSFTEGISLAQRHSANVDYKIRGGVVPHHLLASFMISDFFQKLSYQKPETIILIGPNHTESGIYKVLTTNKGWNTKYGVVLNSSQLTNALVSRNLAKYDGSVVASDQSISALMPYISFYMPYAKVVPLLVSSKMSNQDLELLSNNLAEMLKEDKNILVASVDFSHYLSFDQSKAKDLQSISAIKKFGCKQLLEFDSQNLDSPESVCALLYTMLETGATNIEILNHDNSAKIQKSREDNTTSYFSIFFH